MARTPRSTAYHNGEPEGLPTDPSTKAARLEFGKRLQRALVTRGMNQAELAQKVSTLLGKHFGRDSVSQYIRGVALPNPERLGAIAKALGTTSEQLLPTRGLRGVASITQRLNAGLEVREDADDERFHNVNIVGMRVKKERMKELMDILYDVD